MDDASGSDSSTMRLLNVHTFAFEEFVGEVGNGVPPYAILSHTWGPEEVTFKDYTEQLGESCVEKRYDKIRGCCRLAESEGFHYAWIDTCCIDKSSSAELSEAINSMFQWYRDAAICYAYLSDVDGSKDPCELADGDNQANDGSSFAGSRWFTRGWTLQELLAPSEVVFLAADWSEIGTKKSLRAVVSQITRISETVLLECRWDEYSVAQKMSWAAGRQTTRLEDAAYCLMGLFDVNMPLLYGEGRKAFSRLQQQILQRSEDHSIFAWSYPDDEHSHTLMSGMMAPSPEYFKDASQIQTMNRDDDYEGPFEVVNQLVRLRLRLLDEVQGVKLQAYASKPLLNAVVEVQQVDKRPQVLAQDSDVSTASNVQPLPQDTHENPSIISNLAKPVSRVTITIDTTHLPRSVDDSPHKSSQDPNESNNNSQSEDVNLMPIDLPMWRWYIYEKVVIAPLRCRIGRSQLGILLSGNPTQSVGGKVKLRLHNPSLVTLDNIIDKLKAAVIQAMYVAVSMVRAPSSNLSSFRRVWPEIRFHSLKAAGYGAVVESGPVWIVDTGLSTFKQVGSHEGIAWAIEDRNAPLVLFCHQSGKDSTYPTLFLRLRASSVPVTVPTRRKEDALQCDVGIYNPASSRSTASMVEDFCIYSTNLFEERQMEVALGHDGNSVAIRLREGHGAFFVNVSFQKACRRRLQAPQDISDVFEIKWLTTQLFPRLKSARATFHKA